MIHETSVHAQIVTVWCVLWRESVIGHSLSENDEVQTEKVNVERYKRMITDYF